MKAGCFSSPVLPSILSPAPSLMTNGSSHASIESLHQQANSRVASSNKLNSGFQSFNDQGNVGLQTTKNSLRTETRDLSHLKNNSDTTISRLTSPKAKVFTGIFSNCRKSHKVAATPTEITITSPPYSKRSKSALFQLNQRQNDYENFQPPSTIISHPTINSDMYNNLIDLEHCHSSTSSIFIINGSHDNNTTDVSSNTFTDSQIKSCTSNHNTTSSPLLATSCQTKSAAIPISVITPSVSSHQTTTFQTPVALTTSREFNKDQLVTGSRASVATTKHMPNHRRDNDFRNMFSLSQDGTDDESRKSVFSAMGARALAGSATLSTKLFINNHDSVNKSDSYTLYRVSAQTTL